MDDIPFLKLQYLQQGMEFSKVYPILLFFLSIPLVK